MLPNDGILFNGVLIPKLLKNPSAFCSAINVGFYYHIPHILMMTLIFHILFLTFLNPIFFVFSLHFKQYVSMFV